MQNNLVISEKYEHDSENFDRELLKVKLSDNGEPMVDVLNLVENNGIQLEIAAGVSAYLRRSVAEKLVEAVNYFIKHGYKLRLESAYRDLDTQKSRFISRYLVIRSKFPDLSKQQQLMLANIFTAGIPILAAHTAGAAVDVTLLKKNGQPLDFGAPFNNGGAESVTDYTDISDTARKNRRILKKGMEKCGFTNYPFEYWHYSIGDVCAAYLRGQKHARYGPVKFDPKTKRQTQALIPQELYNFFTV